MGTPWTAPLDFGSNTLSSTQMDTYVSANTLHLKENIGNVRAVATKTTTYTATVNDGLLLCNGTFTLTLPTAAAAGAGFVLQVKNIGTGVVTIDGNGSETIDGALTLPMAVQYTSVTLCCDGSNWLII